MKKRFSELKNIKGINLIYCATFSNMSHPKIGELIERNEKGLDSYLQNIRSCVDFIYKNSFNSGVFFYHPLGKIDIEKYPKNINFENELTYKQELNEERIKYMLWKYFKKKGYITATESVLQSISESQDKKLP